MPGICFRRHAYLLRVPLGWYVQAACAMHCRCDCRVAPAGLGDSRCFKSDDDIQGRVGCVGGDGSIEHYAVCPHLLKSWSQFSGLPSPNGPLGFMCLAHENQSVMKIRMSFLYCAHSVIMRLHANSETIDSQELEAVMRERKRFICGQSPEVRHALREISVNKLRVIQESWPELEPDDAEPLNE